MEKSLPIISVIHGPNLHLLGTREPAVYGSLSLAQIDEQLQSHGRALGFNVECEQHNAEGAIIDALTQQRLHAKAIILNAGAFTHYSYAIRDAISAVQVPVLEVHLSNIAAREPFRALSVIAPACRGSICGFGVHSYTLALDAVARILQPVP